MLIAYIISFIVIAFACGLVVGWMIEKAMMEERNPDYRGQSKLAIFNGELQK